MNEFYARFLETAHVPGSLRSLATAATKMPSSLWSPPSGVFGFPPALTPILQGTGPCYYGYWRHWFISRPPTYVEAFSGQPFTVSEFARTDQQFAIRLVLNLIEMSGSGSDAIEEFAAKIGTFNYDALLLHWELYGESESKLDKLPQFAEQMPRGRSATGPGYTGSFPSWNFTDHQEWWLSACSLEIDPSVLANWPNELPVPEYLTDKNGLSLFKDYLDADGLDLAWLSLNSSGWETEEAQEAIELLKTVAKDSAFGLLADAWLQASDAFRICY